MNLLTPADFEPWVGRKVRIDAVPAPVEIDFRKIRTGPEAPHLPRQPFSLIFSSHASVALISGTYVCHFGRGGPHEIFLSPILSPPGEQLYQAVFS